MFLVNDDHTITLRLSSGDWATYHEADLDLLHFVMTSEVRPLESLRDLGITEIKPFIGGLQ